MTDREGTPYPRQNMLTPLRGGMQDKHPDSQKMLARRNWCEVLPFVEEGGAVVDPRSHNALVSSQLCALACSLDHLQLDLWKNHGGICSPALLRALLCAAQVFVLRVEDPDKQEAPPETFSTIVPTFTKRRAGEHSVSLWALAPRLRACRAEAARCVLAA